MKSVTIYNIRLKNYLNLSYDKRNSPTQSRGDLTTLARAVNNLKLDFKKDFYKSMIKRIIFNIYSASSFVAIIVNLLSDTSTDHSTKSPAFKFKSFTISFGRPTLKEFDLTLAIPTFDLYLNIIIPLLYVFIVINMIVLLYINFLFSINLKSNLKSNIYIVGGSKYNQERILETAISRKFFQKISKVEKMNNNKSELKNTQTREYLDKRFEEFLQKEKINKKDLTETALNVFRRGYRIVFITTLPEEKVEL